jgi:hypothetical protein
MWLTSPHTCKVHRRVHKLAVWVVYAVIYQPCMSANTAGRVVRVHTETQAHHNPGIADVRAQNPYFRRVGTYEDAYQTPGL